MAELDEIGKEIYWYRGSSGATMAVVELDREGNTVIGTRLSSDDRNERLIDQVRPTMALAEREEALRVRCIVLAFNMSGTRYVRADRAPKPPADEEQRDDIHAIDEMIEAGWCRHLIWRDGDRIARKVIYGLSALERWQKNGVGLWLSSQGRKMDYERDGLMLQAMMVVSAEERNNTTRRLQTASINKGPLRGLGWLGTTPFGFQRDPSTHEIRQDPEQWPYIRRAFELAASGKYLDGAGLSTKRVAEKLKEEGCGFDDDHVRKMLGNVIHCTGEFVTHVRGVPITQKPIALTDPVPLSQFQEVQDLLALRQGRSERTPVGEFLFNYVETVCGRCKSPRDERDRGRALIRGYILSQQNPDLRRYRHQIWVPDACKGGKSTFERDDLERPVVEMIRQLATDPDVLKAVAEASRYDESSSAPRLNADAKESLRRKIAELETRRDAVNTLFVERAGLGDPRWNYDDHIAAIHGFNQQIGVAEDQLVTEELLSSQAKGDAVSNSRERDFLEIMTMETPTDPKHLALRARLFQRCVSRIVINHDGAGNVDSIEVEGHLIPEGAELAAGNPILNSADLLDGYALRKQGLGPVPTQVDPEIETALTERAEKAVSMLYHKLFVMQTTHAKRRQEQHSFESTAWRWHERDAQGVAGWHVRFGSEAVAGAEALLNEARPAVVEA